MPTLWRYMVDRKLKAAEVLEYRWRAPLCQVCGTRLARIAERLQNDPYQWVPIGWLCRNCNILDIEGL